MVNIIPVTSQDMILKAKQIAWAEYAKYATPEDYLTLYIDVPYCQSECKYCYHNYGDIQIRGKILDSEIDSLEREMEQAAKIMGQHPVRAINFGGGTPSLLSPRQLERILTMIDSLWILDKSDESERGFEGHPAHITDEYIDVLSSSYMNRLSLGVQTFNRDILKLENRKHISEETLSEIIKKFRQRKQIRSINVDLLAGLIDQTPQILEQDIWSLMRMGVQQITIYKASKTKNHRDHPQIQPEGLWELLHHVNEVFNKESIPWEYIGTANKDDLMKCNRFYLRNFEFFKYSYNPTPWSYNSCIGFTIDRDTANSIQHPWSFFIPANLAYEVLLNSKDVFAFYNILTPLDRLHWGKCFSRRSDERSQILARKFEELRPTMEGILNTSGNFLAFPPYK
jgi:coproporphyrinogen III oxidase-like Fe-S oxidoreductase